MQPKIQPVQKSADGQTGLTYVQCYVLHKARQMDGFYWFLTPWIKPYN